MSCIRAKLPVASPASENRKSFDNNREKTNADKNFKLKEERFGDRIIVRIVSHFRVEGRETTMYLRLTKVTELCVMFKCARPRIIDM